MISSTPQPGAPPPRFHASDERRERRLFQRYSRFGDRAAREELTERFLPLARRLARRYSGGAEPLDDLTQVASVGLVKAIDRFDPERGHPFTTYAIPMISGELKRHFRDHTWAMRITRAEQERILLVNRTVEALARKLGRSPSAAEVAADTGLAVEDVVAALVTATAVRPTSLDDAVAAEDRGERSRLPRREDAGFESVVSRDLVARSLSGLSDRDHLVVYMRFVEDLTQSEIGKRVGVSQMQVSRILRESLDRMRDATPDAVAS